MRRSALPWRIARLRRILSTSSRNRELVKRFLTRLNSSTSVGTMSTTPVRKHQKRKGTLWHNSNALSTLLSVPRLRSHPPTSLIMTRILMRGPMLTMVLLHTPRAGSQPLLRKRLLNNRLVNSLHHWIFVAVAICRQIMTLTNMARSAPFLTIPIPLMV